MPLFYYYGEKDYLVFEDASLTDDLKFYCSSNNLVIKYSDDSNDSIIVSNYFKTNPTLKYIKTTIVEYHEQYVNRINDAISKYKKYEYEDRYKKGTRLRDLINNVK